jgi:hypothetical protein
LTGRVGRGEEEGEWKKFTNFAKKFNSFVMEIYEIKSGLRKPVEIKLLANSKENQGRNKLYDRVAGCLIAYACSLASKKYEGEACVSLLPKTNLVSHYMQKYRMVDGGRQLYLENERLDYITNKYLYVSSKTEREGYPGGT